MGKIAQWIKSLLTRKKGGEICRGAGCPRSNPAETRSGPLPMTGPKERRRRSFRRSATGRATERKPTIAQMETDADKKRRVAAAAAAAVQDAIVVMRLTAVAVEAVEEDAAVPKERNKRSRARGFAGSIKLHQKSESRVFLRQRRKRLPILNSLFHTRLGKVVRHCVRRVPSLSRLHGQHGVFEGEGSAAQCTEAEAGLVRGDPEPTKEVGGWKECHERDCQLCRQAHRQVECFRALPVSDGARHRRSRLSLDMS